MTMLRRTALLAALAALALGAPLATLHSQSVRLGMDAASARQVENARFADTRIPRVLHATLGEYGYNADRLSRAERRALEDVHGELFPRTGPLARAQLNRAQAVALVYVALVEPSRDRGWPGRGRAVCGEAGERVYSLARAFADAGTGHRLFLSREEQEQARRGARDIQQAAAGCGQFRLADQAMDLLALLNSNLAERNRVGEQIDRMRRTVQEPDVRR
jgi:hypothetical protein